MDWLKEKMISAIDSSGLNSVAIMLNGKYLKTSGKRVYVSVASKEYGKSLVYYTKQYTKNGVGSIKQELQRLATNWTGWIRGELESSSLFGCETGIKQILERSQITVNADHEFLNIQSEMYQYAVKLSETNGRTSISIDGQVLTAETVSQLRKVFLNESLLNYREMVYARGANRFVRRLIHKNKFYGIRPESFVPVFIRVKGVYNPLDNPALAVDKTAMYQKAIEKNRFVDTGDVSAYFLTHKEICEAFGMQHFVRFKSSIWFDVFVGVLQPNNINFPNNGRMMLCWTEEVQPPSCLKKMYTEEEFINVVNEFKDQYPNELNSYSKNNTLDYYVRQNYSTIRHIGPTMIDDGVTVSKLCAYYNEAKLQ